MLKFYYTYSYVLAVSHANSELCDAHGLSAVYDVVVDVDVSMPKRHSFVMFEISTQHIVLTVGDLFFIFPRLFFLVFCVGGIVPLLILIISLKNRVCRSLGPAAATTVFMMMTVPTEAQDV